MLSRNMVWFADPSVLHLWGELDPDEQPNPIIPAVNVGMGNNVRLTNQFFVLMMLTIFNVSDYH